MSPETKKLIESDPKLQFHMFYALWNGPGFFKKFTQDLNNSVEKGITDTNELFDIAMKSRENSAVGRSAAKIRKIFQS
jgi:hypothetical protein